MFIKFEENLKTSLSNTSLSEMWKSSTRDSSIKFNLIKRNILFRLRWIECKIEMGGIQGAEGDWKGRCWKIKKGWRYILSRCTLLNSNFSILLENNISKIKWPEDERRCEAKAAKIIF